MAVNNATGYNRTTREPLDALYLNSGSTYANTASANAAININVRYTGSFVNVSSSLYWYKDGIQDTNLVPFMSQLDTGSLTATGSFNPFSQSMQQYTSSNDIRVTNVYVSESNYLPTASYQIDSSSFDSRIRANSGSMNNYVLKAGDTMSGNLILSGSSALDSALSGGTDILNIGTSNADVINIGWSGATINIQGTSSYQNVNNLNVKDKLITLNKSGSAGSGISSGFEIEEGGSITGYFATDATRTGWDFKSPASQQLTFGLDLLTTSRLLKAPDASGTILLDNRTLTINGQAYDLSADRTWTITTTGTANRISVSGGSGLTPTIDIASTYVGQTSITTLGTITTGVWNATPIVNAYLANSAVTVTAGTGLSGGGAVSLGGTITLNNTITQYTDALARASLSFTAGSGGYNSTTGVITIPTNNSQISNGAGYITAGASYYIGTTLNALNRASGSQTLTGVSIDGNAATATEVTNLGGIPIVFPTPVSTGVDYVVASVAGSIKRANSTSIQSFLGLGSNAYTSTAFLPLTAGSGNPLSGSLYVGNGSTDTRIFVNPSTNYGLGFSKSAGGVNVYLGAINSSGDLGISSNAGTLLHTFYQSGAISFSGSTSITDATASTSTTTGALVVPNGGVGIGGALNVGGDIKRINGSSSTTIGYDGVYSAATDLYLFSPSSYNTRIYAGGSEKITILSSGNVGIGTTSPISLLDIYNQTVNNYGIISLRGTSRGGEIDFYDGATVGASISGGTGTDKSLYFTTNGGSSVSMAIKSGGNVGIGITTPNFTTTNRTVLDVNGTSTSLISLSNGGTPMGYLYNNGSSLQLYSTTTLNLSGATSVLVQNLLGSGNIIVYADNSGNLGKMAIGSGLSFSGGTLSATGGAPGTVTYSGTTTASYIPKWTSASDLTNSIMSESGGVITVGGNLSVSSTSNFNGVSTGVISYFNAPTSGGTITFQTGGVSYGDIGAELGNFGTGSSTNLIVSARSGKDLILGGGGLKTLTLASSGAATFASSVSMGALSATSGSFSSTVSATRFTSNTGDGVFFNSYSGGGQWQVGSDPSVGSGMYLYHSSGGYVFTLSSGGALGVSSITTGAITSTTYSSSTTTGYLGISSGTMVYQYDVTRIYPTLDATRDLGLGAYRFRDAYLSGQVIAGSFTGAGTGLTGTASSLTAGAIVSQANSATITASSLPSTSSTIVQRDTSGYIYIQSPNYSSGTFYFSTYMAASGRLEYATVAQAQSALGLGSAAYTSSSAYLAVGGNAVSATLASTVTVTSYSSTGTYNLIWHNGGNALYETPGVTITPNTGAITAGTFYKSSDSRLKTIINGDYLLDDISKLKAKFYTKNGITELGYFAQDAQLFMPYAVSARSNGYLDLDYTQVLVAKMESVEDRVARLEGENEQLKKQIITLGGRV